VNTLALYDTEPVAMEGLRRLMESIDGPRVVAAETGFEEVVAAVRDLQPTMLMLDRAFGARALTDWMRALGTCEVHPAVIVWGSPMSETEALRYLHAGAAGVIRKSAPLADLIHCIRAVEAGGNWMDSDIAHGPPVPVRGEPSALTPREVQVTELIERGFKNKDIGQSLGIRTGTVKIHLRHIFEKTGIRGRYGLAISGLQRKGLLAAVV
jgi:DNA-binding NarL/FixJ family response regulator